VPRLTLIMPPSFNRSHYYLRDLAQECNCGYCRSLNYGYNRLDFARFNHFKDLHPQRRQHQIQYPARRLAIRQFPDPNVPRRVFFRSSTARGY